MKKIATVLFVMFISGITANAQDTIRYMDPWYQFNEYEKIDYMWWKYDYPYIEIGPKYLLFESQRYTKTGSRNAVYGIAATMNYYPISRETHDYVPSFKLYRQTTVGGNPMLVVVDTVADLNFIKQAFFDYQTADSLHPYYTRVTPCYEFYFDTPIDYSTLSDTFFVSYNWLDSRLSGYLYYLDSIFDPAIDTDTAVFCYKNWIFMHYALESPAKNRWLVEHRDEFVYGDSLDMGQLANYYMIDAWGGLFPIVQLRCVAPRVRLVGRGEGGTATVRWEASEAGEGYQLAIGEYGGDPATATLVVPAPGDSTHTFTGLADGVRHAVWVRKSCRYTTAGYDTVVWSDWSVPAAFFTLGIGEATDGAEFAASPNPAFDRVTLTLAGAAGAGCRAEVVDATGRTLFSAPVEPTATRVDLNVGRYPAGLYIVKLVSPRGVSTRRLVVAH